jgi:hypothetical protein
MKKMAEAPQRCSKMDSSGTTKACWLYKIVPKCFALRGSGFTRAKALPNAGRRARGEANFATDEKQHGGA